MSKKKKKLNLKNLILLLGVVILALAVIVFTMDIQEKRKSTTDEQSSVHVDVDGQLRTIEVNGVTYQQKPDIRNYIIMGIDHMDQENLMERGDLGQNDLIIVLTVNDTDKTYQMLQINRDSMVDVIEIDKDGNETGTGYKQIALAHSYGDGRETSCQNVVNTVSRLLWNEDFEGYVAINMEAVNILADAVGGVPVQVNDDFSAIDPSLVQGQTVTLTGANALTFVRSRYNVADESNANREERQQEFINSFINKAGSLGDQNINDIYNSINDYKLSNMPNSSVVNLMVKMKTYTELPMLHIEGTSTANEETHHNEYRLKNSSLQQVILSLFYDEKAAPND